MQQFRKQGVPAKFFERKDFGRLFPCRGDTQQILEGPNFRKMEFEKLIKEEERATRPDITEYETVAVEEQSFHLPYLRSSPECFVCVCRLASGPGASAERNAARGTGASDSLKFVRVLAETADVKHSAVMG